MNFTMSHNKYVNITEHVSVQQFEQIQRFILANGDRKTYRNIDSNNPHYRFNNFDIFLNPENVKLFTGNPDYDKFNEITIYDPSSEIQYYTLRVVKAGDRENSATHLPEHNDDENRVYLLNIYNEDIDLMKKNLLEYYLKEIYQKML
ncbi:hypothetical protein LVD17_12535 [Fulvivirga ulvae]|uniref:hypothetical protein n=1 Tax=Fulvivirga ulvae TaxID=2904245 RepID=UPI001F3DB068|nr:hypothetical protein [Fulvivirga ulvae]UII34635.1 hypothetical protein LVD17_12535 [Fulvivirga ulvae]